MQYFYRNSLIVILLFLVSSFILYNMRLTKGNVNLEAYLENIPLNIREWKGKNLKIPSYVYEILETRNILMREYIDENGGELILTIVCSEGNRGSFHPPEICYAGGEGVEFLEKKKDTVPLEGNNNLEVNKLLMKSTDGLTTAWYWFLAGDEYVSSYYQQQLRLFLDALRGKSGQGALIRVSVHGNSESIEDKTKSFITLLVPYMHKTE